MATDKTIYQSYLLRLWLVDQDGAQAWRCSLEEALSGQRRTFANLDAMVAFIRAKTIQGTGFSKEELS